MIPQDELDWESAKARGFRAFLPMFWASPFQTFPDFLWFVMSGFHKQESQLIYTAWQLGSPNIKITARKHYYCTERKQMKTGNSKPFFPWCLKLLMQISLWMYRFSSWLDKKKAMWKGRRNAFSYCQNNNFAFLNYCTLKCSVMASDKGSSLST